MAQAGKEETHASAQAANGRKRKAGITPRVWNAAATAAAAAKAATTAAATTATAKC